METITARYARTIYQTDDKGVCIAHFIMSGAGKLDPKEQITVLGVNLPTSKGISFKLVGDFTTHPKYGRQFNCSSFAEDLNSKSSLITYLSSGMFKGIGKKGAEKIVNRFGMDTLSELDKDIQVVKTIKGISKSSADKFIASYTEMRKYNKIVTMLSKYGISPKMAKHAFDYFDNKKEDVCKVLETEGYRLCEVSGISFETADRIGKENHQNSSYETDFNRFISCAFYVLMRNETLGFADIIGSRVSGSLGMNKEDFGTVMFKYLFIESLSKKDVCDMTCQMLKEKYLYYNKKTECLYTSYMYDLELMNAAMLNDLLDSFTGKIDDIEKEIASAEEELSITLSDEQKTAVANSLNNTVSLIIGPPGSGKTTVLNTIQHINRKKLKKSILFLAPTGKAASRITEQTGCPARTIHSALSLTTNLAEENLLAKDGEESFDDTILVVDEMSMTSTRVFYRLLQAVGKNSKLIMCGDDEQLQSVGGGAVLRDLIKSNLVPLVELKRVYRQAKGSSIYENCIKLRQCKTDLVWDKDFSFTEVENMGDTENEIVRLYFEKVSEYGEDNVMVLAPFRKHEAGVYALNKRIQERIHAGDSRPVFIADDNTYHINDLIMQLKNDKENNVMNGEIGQITDIKSEDGVVTVIAVFEHGTKEYTKENSDEFTLAYSYTIHKAQGSEAKCVIVCVNKMHGPMLKKNIFYTAITRAREEVCVVGQKKAFEQAVSTEDKSERITLLGDFLQTF